VSQSRSSDPLLSITQFLLRLIMVVMAVIIIAGVVAVAALLVMPDQQLAPQLAARGTAGWVAAGAAMLVVILALGIAFIRALTRIIGSVGDGDPFRPDNADRLSQMGWIALALQVCNLILAPISGVIADRVGEANGIDTSFDTLILALVLFILARVFRHGTQLRDDLEGTV
jgi:MFS family permease